MGLPTLAVDIDFEGNPTASYADIHSTDDGVVSFWRMNSTSTFDDELGVNDGVMISTPTTIAGPYVADTDVGLTFDGANDSAYVPNSATLTTNSGFSVDGWVRVSSLPGSTVDLVTKRGSWLVQMNSSGKILWTLKDDTSTVTVTSNSVLTTNTWYHVTGVYDDAAALLYINGILDSSSAYSSGTEQGSQPLRFAGQPDTSPAWGTSATNSGTSGTGVGNRPASTADGDLLFAHIHQGAGNTTTTTITAEPSGWILLGSQASDGRAQEYGTWLYYKIASGEPATWSWTFSQVGTWIVAVSRVTGYSTVDAFSNPTYSVLTNSGAHATGTHVPNVNNNLILAFFSCDNSATWTQSSGTERYDVSTGSNSACMCSQTQAAAASLDVTATASSSDDGAAYMVVLAGNAVTETACSLDDWTYWNRALDTDGVRRNYESRNGGTSSSVWSSVVNDFRNGMFSTAQRQYELDKLEAGSGQCVLLDRTFRYDPTNTSSVFAPKVIPRRRMRVRANHTVSGVTTTYDIARHYIERWPRKRKPPRIQEIDITTTDGFLLLSNATISGDMDAGYAGEQIDTLLNKALWPVADRSLAAGQFVMEGQTFSAGTNALGSIQELADSELGRFYIRSDGVAVFEDALTRLTASRSITSQVVFSDAAEGGGVLYQDLVPSFDDDRIINQWSVTPGASAVDTSTQIAIDHISVAKYGLEGRSRSTRLALGQDALAQAHNLLNKTAEPANRFDTLTVQPTTDYGFQKCLDLRISDRVTVKSGFGSLWTGPEETRDCYVEQKVSSLVDTRTWVFTFTLTPVSNGNYYGTIMRDDPVSYWRLNAIT